MKQSLELTSPSAPILKKPAGPLWVKELDRLLRGKATEAAALRRGELPISSDRLQIAIVLLGMTYGLCMGVYALLKGDNASVLQLIAGMVKVPALFLLTLLVTFPSLYVFNALIGSRLSVGTLWRLLTSSVALNMAVLASLGPIVAFFSLSTTSYSFMLLLNVFMFSIAGVLGLKFLLQTLRRLSVPPAEAEQDPPVISEVDSPAGPLDQAVPPVAGRQLKRVFACWVIAFALVGAQMSWLLRPFLGNPSTPFSFFRARESNFFEAVWTHVAHLLGW